MSIYNQEKIIKCSIQIHMLVKYGELQLSKTTVANGEVYMLKFIYEKNMIYASEETICNTVEKIYSQAEALGWLK